LWEAVRRNCRVRKEMTKEVKEEQNGKEYGALDEKI
jgi:hypothetical protein